MDFIGAEAGRMLRNSIKDKIFIGDKMIPIDQVKMINIKNS